MFSAGIIQLYITGKGGGAHDHGEGKEDEERGAEARTPHAGGVGVPRQAGVLAARGAVVEVAHEPARAQHGGGDGRELDGGVVHRIVPARTAPRLARYCSSWTYLFGVGGAFVGCLGTGAITAVLLWLAGLHFAKLDACLFTSHFPFG